MAILLSGPMAVTNLMKEALYMATSAAPAQGICITIQAELFSPAQLQITG